MKRLSAWLAVLALATTLGCGGSKANSPDTAEDPFSATEEPVEVTGDPDDVDDMDDADDMGEDMDTDDADDVGDDMDDADDMGDDMDDADDMGDDMDLDE